MSALHDLARKHRVQPDGLGELLTELHTELDALTGGSEQLEALEKAMADTALAWRTQADKLSALRQQGAIKLSQRVMEMLDRLAMGSCVFDIALIPFKETIPIRAAQRTSSF